MNKYDHFSNEEFLLLAIYTLFDATNSQVRNVKVVMEKLTGKPCKDFIMHIRPLKEAELLKASNYNWRTDSYDYSIMEEEMIPLMLHLVENQKPLTLQVLKAAAKLLKPSYMQRLAWDYIINDFQLTNLEDINDYQIGEAIDTFLPVVTDQRFASLLMTFSTENFFSLINSKMSCIFTNETMCDPDYLESLVRSFSQREPYGNYMHRILCLIDLYRFLAYGKKPQEIFANNKNHRIIAAIHEAYHGNLTQALEHFKKAVILNNQDNSNNKFTTSRSYLLLSISNFFYVLVAHMTGTEDGRKKCLTISKAAERNFTVAAKNLYSILTNSNTTNQLRNNLCSMLAGDDRMDRILAILMCYYIGKKDLLSEMNISEEEMQPRWLILKHEMRNYISCSNTADMDGAYGKQGLLSSIYRKQEWESVLDDLNTLTKHSNAASSAKTETRLAYFIQNIHNDHVEVRQQNILKSGTWGAGKKVDMHDFFEGSLDCMNAEDRSIAVNAVRKNFSSFYVDLKYVLPAMTQESRLYVGQYSPYTLVEVTEEMPYLTLVHDSDGFRITSNVPRDRVDGDVIITHHGAASINFIRMSDEQRPYYRRLLSLNHFPNEAEDQLRAFLQNIGGKIEVNSDLIEGGSTLPVTDGNPQLVMQMRPHDRDSYIVGVFVRPLEGGHIRLKPGDGDELIIDSGTWTDSDGTPHEGRTRVQRNIAAEKDNLMHFNENAMQLTAIGNILNSDATTIVDTYDLLPLIEYAHNNPDRISCEWPEGAQMKLKQKQTASAWNGAIKKNENGWFEIEGSVELDQGKVVTMAQLLDLASQSRGRFIKLGDGEFLALSDKLRRQLMQLSTIASRSKGKLIMSPFSAALLGASTLKGELTLTEDEELKAIRKRIKESGKYSPEVPKELNATLREYQKEGYQWMSRLNQWGAGALLADDMGLGKTIQTITFLLSKTAEGPALVIAPASVAPNWITEFGKFAPSLHVTMLNFAEDRTATIKEAKAGDVVVTTYGLLLSVKDDITTKKWTTICLDEAHIIKNRGAKTSAVAMQLKSEYRLMLTGTPVQNHLGELWNLFQFVNPGLLGSFEDFNRRFIIPIEQNGDDAVQHELDRLVKPFMLRRTKDKVAKELPDKQEIYQHVSLSDEEQLIYEALRQKAEAMLLAEEGNKVSMTTLAEITRLRQCACDTRLTEEGKKGSGNKQGSKITALVELLSTVLEGVNHKGGVLVFSQFTSYLALIKDALNEASIPYLYIDGAVPIKERQQLVKKFQAGECPVFLISLKAGGLGLNLTRANYVIHMDPWWNPAIEAQATDRAHRIGQKQAVTVYHLIAEGTIEEKIQRLHEQKRALVENILESTDMSHKLTGEDLLNMIHR